MPQQHRIQEFVSNDRVLHVKTDRWGTILGVPGEPDAALMLQFDTGDLEEIQADEVLHEYDANFRKGINLMKKYITSEGNEMDRDLVTALHLLVDCHRQAIDWR